MSKAMNKYEIVQVILDLLTELKFAQIHVTNIASQDDIISRKKYPENRNRSESSY